MSVVAEPTPVPVNALFAGDFITHLVVVMSDDTIDTAAQKVAALVVGSRVKAQDKPYVLRFDGKPIAGARTVAEAGITPLSEVFVSYAE
jgi:hypothetical protein